MDSKLVKDSEEGYLGTAEERIPRAVMYHLSPAYSLADADRAHGWPDGTAVALRHRYPEKWQQAFNALIDEAVGHFQQARLGILERLTTGCPNAIAITESAMEGREWNGHMVTKDQQIAAREFLKLARDFLRDSDLTPATQEDLEADEETNEMEAHAKRLGADELLVTEEAN